MAEESEQEESGFKVIDRRREGRDGESATASSEEASVTEEKPVEETAPPPQSEPAAEPASSAKATQIPTGDLFAHFILSLASSVYLHLGLAPHPETQKSEANLPLAKQTIDILGVLEEKTRGNLSEQEEGMFKQVLSDLKMRYVEKDKN